MASTPLRVPPLEGYRLWSQTWDFDSSPIVALESRLLAPMLEDIAGKRVLDVACGTGRWLVWAEAKAAAVIGVDFCLEMLLQARRKPALAGKLVLGDGRSLPFAGRCADVVICALSLGHMTPIEPVVRELARTARPGGTVIVSDFHPEAARRGWKRTFRRGEQVYEIENHPYAVEDLLGVARTAGLQLEEILESCFGEQELPIFRQAGKEHLFDEARGIPAVLIARWKCLR